MVAPALPPADAAPALYPLEQAATNAARAAHPSAAISARNLLLTIASLLTCGYRDRAPVSAAKW
jgi:hypothetical protein